MTALVLALLAALSPVTYHLRGTATRPPIAPQRPGHRVKSCGAAARMLAGDYRVVVRGDGRAYINGTEWRLDGASTDDSMLVLHHGDPSQRVHLAIYLSSEGAHASGLYMLSGLNEDRVPCVDVVGLTGYKLR